MLTLVTDIATVFVLGVLAVSCAAGVLFALWVILHLAYTLVTGRVCLPVRRIDQRPMRVVDYPLCDFKWPDTTGFCNAPATVHVDGHPYCRGHAPEATKCKRVIILKGT